MQVNVTQYIKFYDGFLAGCSSVVTSFNIDLIQIQYKTKIVPDNTKNTNITTQ